jgi:hypothetical protein
MPSRFDFNSGPGYRHACEADHSDRDGSVLAHLWKIPNSFYNDHVARDLPGGVVERSNKRYSWVWLSEADRLELISDADYYADSAAEIKSDGGPDHGPTTYSLVKAIAWPQSSTWDSDTKYYSIGYGSWRNRKTVDVTTEWAALKRAKQTAKKLQAS